MFRRTERNRQPISVNAPKPDAEVGSSVCWYKTRAGNDAFTYRSQRFPGTLFRYVSSQGSRIKQQTTWRFVCVSCSKINNYRVAHKMKSISASGVSIRNGDWLDDPDYPYWEHICIVGLHCVDRPRNTKKGVNVKLPNVDAIPLLKYTHEGQTVLDEVQLQGGDVHKISSTSYRHLIRTICADLFERSHRQMPPVHEKRAYAQAFFKSIGANFNPKDNKVIASMGMRIRRLQAANSGSDKSEKDDDEEQGEKADFVEEGGADSYDFNDSQFDYDVDETSQGPPEKRIKSEMPQGSFDVQVGVEQDGEEFYLEDDTFAMEPATHFSDINSVFVEPNNSPAEFFETSDNFERDLAMEDISAQFLEMGLRQPDAESFEQIWEGAVVDKLINIGVQQPFAHSGMQRFLQFKGVDDGSIDALLPNDRSELALRLLPIALFGNDHGYFSKHLTKIFIECHANMKTIEDLKQFHTTDMLNYPVIVKVHDKYMVVASKKAIRVEGGFSTALRILVEIYAVLNCEIPFEVYLPVRFLQYIYDIYRYKISEEHKDIFERVLSFL
uniref:Non-specific serine/threonine protein kinase n=1 Tax=Steinernema glaseri TaxID=37863 RepID=A0A1I7YDJ5_9BILA